VLISLYLLEWSNCSSYNATRRVQWKLTLLVQDTIFAVLRGQDAAITSLGAGRP